MHIANVDVLLLYLPTEYRKNACFRLDICYNNITYIAPGAFDNLYNLASLQLTDNKLTFMPAPIAPLSGLSHISLSTNCLSSLANTAFYGSVGLFILELQHNHLSDIHPGTFHALHHLIHLDLSHNMLSYWGRAHLTGLTSLIKLDLAHNNIHMISPLLLQHSPRLVVLRLAYNNLTSVPPLTSAKIALAGYTPEVFSKLALVDLEGNRVRRIDPSVYRMTEVVDVNLKNNSILRPLDNVVQHARLSLSKPPTCRDVKDNLEQGEYDSMLFIEIYYVAIIS